MRSTARTRPTSSIARSTSTSGGCATSSTTIPTRRATCRRSAAWGTEPPGRDRARDRRSDRAGGHRVGGGRARDPGRGRGGRRGRRVHGPDDGSRRLRRARAGHVRRLGHDRRHRGVGGRRARERGPGGRARAHAREAAGRDRWRGPADRRRRLRGPRPARGTGGARQPRRLVQPDGRLARAAGADAPRLHRERRARAADPADEPAGLPRGAARRRDRRRPGDLRIPPRGGRPTRPAVPFPRCARRRRRGNDAVGRRRARSRGRRQVGAGPRRARDRTRRSHAPDRGPGHVARPSRSRRPCPGARQPALERRPVHAGRRLHHGPCRAAAGRPPRLDLQHRRGHPARGPRSRVRAVLPGREVARPGARRRRHRPGDREAARGRAAAAGRRGVARGHDRFWFSLPG